MELPFVVAAGLALSCACTTRFDIPLDEDAKPNTEAADAAVNVADASTGTPRLGNARSIGSHAGALASLGQVNATEGSYAMHLASATFPSNVGRGDKLTLWPGTAQEQVLYVDSQTNDTELLLASRAPAGVEQAPYQISRAYSSITDWSMATAGDLVSAERLEIGVCYNDGPFAENVILAGATTNDMYYRHLTVADVAKHSGVAGTGALIDPTVPGHGIYVGEDYARVDWLEITDWTRDSGGSFDGINIQATNVLIEHVIVHDDGHGAVLNSDAGGIQLEIDLGSATVRNSIVYNLARNGIAIHNVTDAVLNIDNSTAYRCVQDDNLAVTYGCISVRGEGNVANVRNVIALAGGGELDFLLEGTSSFGVAANNMSSDASAPGADSIHNETATIFSSATPGSEDLHLALGVSALDSGLDLSDEFGDDIDGQNRTPPWDIGADER